MFELRPRTYAVVAIKRDTNEEIRGTMIDDGLASLWYITPHDGGEPRVVSVLDRIVEKTLVEAR